MVALLPYLTADLPGIGGVLRAQPDDFVVDEQLPYAATGAGDHVFAQIEKRELNTGAAVAMIARALAIAERDIGVAGLKDRHAVTRQWLSLPPPTAPEQVIALADSLAGIRVLAAARHPHKLRTGHVRANRFTLRVRDAGANAAVHARAILAALAEPPGAPNWYGEQRFGRDGDNGERGRALLAGGDGRRRFSKADRFLVSALQSELFNAWLTARVTDGLYRDALAGDVMHKRGGGLFDCTEPAVDGPRIAAGEIVATGPMFGADMRAPTEGTGAAAREAAILAAAGLSRASFAAARAIAPGTRRDAAIAIAIAEPSVVDEPDAGAIVVSFALPGGAYATTIMREVMKAEGIAPTAEAASPDAHGLE